MYYLMKEDAVEKARNRALKKQRKGWEDSLARRWGMAHQMIGRLEFSEGSSPLAYPAWWECKDRG